MLGPRLDVKGGVSSVTRLIIDAPTESTEIFFLPSMNDKSLFGRLSHFISRIVKFPYEWYRIGPDVVHIHFSHSLSTWRKILLSRIWRLSGARIVLHAHSSDYKEYFPKLPGILRWFVTNSIRKSDLLVVLSESWKDFYVNELGINHERVEVLPNPIKLPLISQNKSDQPISVLFSGRIGERKGTFDLLLAWSRISPSIRSRAKLTITGDGEISKARKLVEDLSISDSVNVLGWIPLEELESLFSTSSIYVLTSRNEGLPMGLLEAMSHSSAVITSPVGGIPELIDDGINGILVKPGDIESITDSLEKLISNDEARKIMSSNARKSVEPLDIENYNNRIEQLWRNHSNPNQ